MEAPETVRREVLNHPDFQPGFRISPLDSVILCAGLVGSILLGWLVWWAGFTVGFVVLHFFLFCNVFRIPRGAELIWSAGFIVLAGSTIITEFPGWIATVVGSIVLSSFLIWRWTKSEHYDGIFWERFNPKLAKRWEPGASASNRATSVCPAGTNSLKFEPDEVVNRPISIKDCEISTLETFCVLFDEKVLLRNCTICKTQIHGGAFYQGLVFENCKFTEKFEMLYTGHNRSPASIRFSECRFEVFADFMDCWFEGPVVFSDCEFLHGSNLLGNVGKPYAVNFDVYLQPTIKNVRGDLRLNGRNTL